MRNIQVRKIDKNFAKLEELLTLTDYSVHASQKNLLSLKKRINGRLEKRNGAFKGD